MTVRIPCYARVLRLIGRLACDRGSVAIETGFLLPLFLFAGIGGAELSSSYINKSKVSRLSQVMADTVTVGGGDFTEKELTDLFSQIDDLSNIKNYSQSGRLILTAVLGKADGTVDKLWQRCVGLNTFPTQYPNAKVILPNGATLAAGTTALLVEAYYKYDPPTSLFLKPASGKLDLSKTNAIYPARDAEFTGSPPNPEAVPLNSSACT